MIIPNTRSKLTKYSICKAWGGRHKFQLSYGFYLDDPDDWDEGTRILEGMLEDAIAEWEGEQRDCKRAVINTPYTRPEPSKNQIVKRG